MVEVQHNQNMGEASDDEPPMSPRSKAEAFKEFQRIIYTNLEKILENRPNFPVSKFAKS